MSNYGFKTDSNHNIIEAKPGPGYTRITRTIVVPNTLIATLQEAAKESRLPGIGPRYVYPPHNPLFVHTMAERRRGRWMSSLNVSEELLSPGANGSSMGYPSPGSSHSEDAAHHDHAVESNTPSLQQARKPREKRTVPSFLEGMDYEVKMGRNRLDAYLVYNSKCCCNRPKKTVWCVMCGFHTKGNVRIPCLKHPLRRYLYELDVCGNPSCRAPNHLIETDW